MAGNISVAKSDGLIADEIFAQNGSISISARGDVTASDIRIRNVGDLIVHEASALDGSVEISVEGALVAESVKAGGAGHDIALSASNGGSVSVGEVVALDGDIAISGSP